MRLLIGLDYELFFGVSTGTIEKCLIEPMDALIRVLDKHGARVTLFVDSGYLAKLEDSGRASELLVVQNHLNGLAKAGHDLQLHIHPHWEDSNASGDGWNLETKRYRLHNFSAADQANIVTRYFAALSKCAEQPVFAYRAGGWCIQPFDEIAASLKSNGIWLDSTVFNNGLSTNQNRGFDFRQIPNLPYWRFSADPTVEDDNGEFVELPISSVKVGPSFFWELAIRRKFFGGNLRNYGDGQALANSGGYYWSRLTSSSYSPVALDGLKAGLLERAYREEAKRSSNPILNVMGHPKSLTPYSIERLDKFLSHHEVESVTCQDFVSLRSASSTA